jgi:hypothetical protein
MLRVQAESLMGHKTANWTAGNVQLAFKGQSIERFIDEEYLLVDVYEGSI